MFGGGGAEVGARSLAQARGFVCGGEVFSLLCVLVQTHCCADAKVHRELGLWCCPFLYPLIHFLQAAKADDILYCTQVNMFDVELKSFPVAVPKDFCQCVFLAFFCAEV